jgi:glycosyltransferase involved in cell wall biosynthesis
VNTLSILLFTPGLTPHFGGSAVSEASLARSLANRCEVSVVCRRGKVDKDFIKSFDLKEVTEYSPLEIFRAWLFGNTWLNDLLKRSDVLHLNGHWKWENYFLCRLSVRYNVPYVFHPRGMLVLGYRKTFLKKVFNLMIGNFIIRNAAKIIALSNFEVRQFQSHPIKDSQIAIIPNGISVPKQYPEDSRARNAFLYIGRIEQRKNLIFLVRAFNAYLKSGGKNRLLLVGPIERGYDKQIQKYISENVSILPPVYGDGKWALMSSATAVIYPTWEEPFGRVPFEALAVGCPVIVPKKSGSFEYLRDKFPDCGYEDDNFDSLITLMRFMDKPSNRELKTQVVISQNWVLTRLAWEKISSEVIQVYREVSSLRAKRSSLTA